MKTDKKNRVQDGEQKSTATAVAPVRGLGEMKIVNRSDCRPSPSNPRKTFTKLEELAESIKSQGVCHALLLRAHPPLFTLHEPDLLDAKNHVLMDAAGKEVFRGSRNHCILNAGGAAGLAAYYEIVDGERRWRSSELAKVVALPAQVYQYHELSDAQVREIQLISFSQREDVSPIEEGESFREMIDKLGYTADTLAVKLGKSRSHIFARLKLATLSPKIRKMVADGKLNSALAELVARIPGDKLQEEAVEEINTGYGDQMSVRQAKNFLEREYTLELAKASFDVKADGLVESVGPCAACPKRSGNCRDLFPDVEGANICTDPTCFKAKTAAAFKIKEEAAKATGQKIMTEEEYARIEYSGKYIEPLESCHCTEGNSEPWKKVMGKEMPEPILAQTSEGWKELILKEDAIAAGKRNGVKFYSSASRGGNGGEAAARKKAILQNKVDDAVVAASVEKFAGDMTGEKLLLVTQATVRSCWHDSMVKIAKRRAWPKGWTEKTVTDGFTDRECFDLLFEILICRGLRGSWGFEPQAKDMAKLLKIDKDKIAAQVKADENKPKGHAILHRDLTDRKIMSTKDRAAIGKAARKRWKQVKKNTVGGGGKIKKVK